MNPGANGAGSSSRTAIARPPCGVTAWLFVCAMLAAGGWILSALGQLNARGYSWFLTISVVCLIAWRREELINHFKRIHPTRVARRFRRALPFGFLLIASLSLLGGLLYLPVNYDALAYRVPRVLHWLAHDQWHWVHTPFPRLNVRACGYEWLIGPLLALTRGSQWLFLPSIISFLLLPGLFFSVLTQFGVKRRIAWHWMWILPTGFCYITQAGSIANDLMGATLVLAAFDSGLRLYKNRNVRDLRVFVIAVGLMTGAKASNFPLLLPLFLLWLPTWKLLFTRPIGNFLAIILAALASFLPTAFFNIKNCGDWTGMSLEGPMKPAVIQAGLNAGNMLILNLSPPVFPFSKQWDELMRRLPNSSPDSVRCLGIPELTGEEEAGIGVGIALLLICGVVASHRLRRRDYESRAMLADGYLKFILWSPYISLLVYLFKAQAVHSASRLITPYYAVLVIPALVYGFDARVLQRRWWKIIVGLVFAMSLGILILTPGRPLWPAQTVLARLHDSHPASSLITRALSVYHLYAERPCAYAPLVAALPRDKTVFGLLTFDDPETSLWWPLGSRRIEHVTPADTAGELAARGIHYVLAPAYCAALSTPVEQLIHQYDAKVVAKVPVYLRTSPGWMDWYVLEISSSKAATSGQ